MTNVGSGLPDGNLDSSDLILPRSTLSDGTNKDGRMEGFRASIGSCGQAPASDVQRGQTPPESGVLFWICGDVYPRSPAKIHQYFSRFGQKVIYITCRCLRVYYRYSI